MIGSTKPVVGLMMWKRRALAVERIGVDVGPRAPASRVSEDRAHAATIFGSEGPRDTIGCDDGLDIGVDEAEVVWREN